MVLNILNPSLNDVGINTLNKFKTITELDLKNSSGLFFVNTSLTAPNIKKIIELKLLKLFSY